MNHRFRLLSTLSTVLKVLGGLVAVLGFLYAFVELLQFGQLHGRYPRVTLGFLIGLGGFLTVAFSEVIHVLFAIEQNTRQQIGKQ